MQSIALHHVEPKIVIQGFIRSFFNQSVSKSYAIVASMNKVELKELKGTDENLKEHTLYQLKETDTLSDLLELIETEALPNRLSNRFFLRLSPVLVQPYSF